jgi:hypothetical protein
VTIAYEGRWLQSERDLICSPPPTAVHFTLSRTAASALPRGDEAGLRAWCEQRFAEKERLLANAVAAGDGTRQGLSLRDPPGVAAPVPLSCAVHCALWVTLATVLVRLCLSSVPFVLYVACASAFAVAVTRRGRWLAEREMALWRGGEGKRD